AEIMDELFWLEAYGPDKEAFLAAIDNDTLRLFADINYGPWSRLDDNAPFIEGVGAKPAGAGFYPTDMTKAEFEALDDVAKTSGYTVLRRDENGNLVVKYYHEAFAEQIEKAAGLLEKAAALCDHEGFKNYLNLRAKALRTDDYFESDMAWMDVKDYKFDFVVGPIENYEDALFGYKNAHESFLLIKDADWSAKLDKFAALLPDLQKSLPVEDKYKAETPGLESDMNVYDAVLYRGDCNAGGKTIAINLPNDERVHIQKGTRKLQLKNAMKAKFDRIMMPIAEVVMTPEQKEKVAFNSFFENVTFHEVAHGMGVKNTINGKGTVRQALKEAYATIAEAKA
ncbi:MAG: Zn-dependent hydrolase, partial [Bacteroidales bacterium]|nr:Zn-dependent hydrolase [Bacteroidales bacterium]